MNFVTFIGVCSPLPSSFILSVPRHPRANAEVLEPDRSGQLLRAYSAIPRYDRATAINCVPVITRLDANSFANAPPWGLGPDGSGERFNSELSIDHACK